MKTNQQMRRETVGNIHAFFKTGIEALTVPEWDGELLTHLEKYKKSPNIHESFYHDILTTAQFNIVLKNEYIDSVNIKLPVDVYARSKSYDGWNGSCIRISIDAATGSEEMLRYCTSVVNMREAAAALVAGAKTALTELTVERTLERLPEIKAFLPRGYKL